jgi:hypothetical protein
MLLAGREGAGKSFGAATASASLLIERTFWIGIGEDDPDEYGAIPGADFEIVVHDGSVADIIRAIRDVAVLPKSEKPYLLVVDSTTKLWDLIVDNVQAIANARAKGRKTATGDYAISPDLWNVAKSQWDDFMDAVRLHRGPSILTARLDEVMVMEDGQPTKEKRWKVQAHKSLVYDVGFVVEMHERGQYLLTKAKSLRLQLEKPTEAPDFTVMQAWDRLGLTADVVTGERTFQSTTIDDPSIEAAIDAWTTRARAATTKDELTAVWQAAQKAQVDTAVLDAIRTVAAEFGASSAGEESQVQAEPLPGSKPGKSKPRDWVREARGLKWASDVEALWKECNAFFEKHPSDESAGVLDQIGQIAASAPRLREVPSEGSEGWAAGSPAEDGWSAEQADAEADAVVEAEAEADPE